MSFDLASPVGDVAWAPFSSTVFAAATEDGKVHVYDLSQDTSAPLCEQLVVKAANLTRISFNPKHPVLLVGDNKCVSPMTVQAAFARACFIYETIDYHCVTWTIMHHAGAAHHLHAIYGMPWHSPQLCDSGQV